MHRTDDDWRDWGERDPYFAVLTDPAFRRSCLDGAARDAFFASGEYHVDMLAACARRHVDPQFSFGRTLDFGCGVGRILIPLARRASSVTGVDISPAMLAEARRNCELAGVSNVVFALSDDTLSALDGLFDFVHSFIVLQHIDAGRARAFFARLVELVAPGGVAALHVMYSLSDSADRFGRPRPFGLRPRTSSALHAWMHRWGSRMGLVPRNPADGRPDPHLQMNPLSLNEMMFVIQRSGALDAHVEFTDHGGGLGVLLMFRRPPAPPGTPRP